MFFSVNYLYLYMFILKVKVKNKLGLLLILLITGFKKAILQYNWQFVTEPIQYTVIHIMYSKTGTKNHYKTYLLYHPPQCLFGQTTHF